MERRGSDANAHRSAPLASATPIGPLRRVLAAVRWYVRALMGDDAYDIYLVRHAREHPGQEPLSLKEFWRRRIDERDRNPTMRCC
ncbi:MAG: YbdD/YjiX family protein [Candidatus Phosphoribacter sp.]